jgi:hypothetical protein
MIRSSNVWMIFGTNLVSIKYKLFVSLSCGLLQFFTNTQPRSWA